MNETGSNFEVVKYTKSVDSSQPLNHSCISSMSTKVSGLWELQLREIEDHSHKTVLRNCFGWFNSWSNDTLYRFYSMCSICFRSAQSTAGRKDQKGERRQSNSRCRRRPDARDSIFDQTLTRGTRHGDTWCKDLWRWGHMCRLSPWVLHLEDLPPRVLSFARLIGIQMTLFWSQAYTWWSHPLRSFHTLCKI